MSNVRKYESYEEAFSWQHKPKVQVTPVYGRDYILAEAKRLLSSDRQEDYGDARDTHKRIAALWNALFPFADFGPDDVAIAMVCVKLARMRTSPQKLDSYVDGAAYLALAGEFGGAK